MEQSRAEVLPVIAHCPVVQRYTAAELEESCGLKGTKVIGVTFGIGPWVGVLVTRQERPEDRGPEISRP